MDTIAKQKALADRIEYILKKDGKDVLLAGGAPRDWYVGREANDLDFYIQTSSRPEDTLGIQRLLNIELKPLGEGRYNRLLAEEPSLLEVYEGVYHGQKVQFMLVTVPPLTFVKEKFDLSICKVWYKEGEICMDWEARLSFRERLLVMKNGFTEHADRLIQRDPWGGFAFLGDWGRALDFLANVNQAGIDLPVDEVDV